MTSYILVHADGRESELSGRAFGDADVISIAEEINSITSSTVTNPIVRITFDDDMQTSAHGLVWVR